MLDSKVEYCTVAQMARRWYMTESNVFYYIRIGRIKAEKVGKYYWIRKDTPMPTRKEKQKKRPIECITTGEKFDSSYEAARKYDLNIGNIWSVCNGRMKQTSGMQWRYAD